MANHPLKLMRNSLVLCLFLANGMGVWAAQLPPSASDEGAREAPLISSLPQAKSTSVATVKEAPLPGPKKILTRAVGEVADHVVTSREVTISDAVSRALDSKETLGKGAEVLTGDEKTFPSELSKLLDIWIVYLEAKSLSAHTLGRQDVAKSVRTVQERWAGKAGWLAIEASPEELREEVERQLLVHEFVAIKSDPSLAPISDEDALSYYNQNRLKFGSLPFAELRENIKTSLAKQQTERRMAEWRDVLRRKYKVRNFIAG